RRHAECPTCLLSPERGLVAHGPVPHPNDPQAERVPASGPDHLRRRRLYPEQRCRPDVPRVPPGVRTIPDPGCPPLRPAGRAGAGGAVNPGHAKSGEQPGLMLVTKSPTEPGTAADPRRVNLSFGGLTGSREGLRSLLLIYSPSRCHVHARGPNPA